MRKYYRPIRLIIASIAAVFSVLAFTSAFYPVHFFDFQVIALTQRTLAAFSLTALILAVSLIVLTLLFGRVYCSTLCPFGLMQELLTLIFRRKTPFEKNRPYKYFLAAAAFGVLAGGSAVLIRLFDPYTLFGSGFSGAWLGLAAFAGIAVLVWFRGRFFCSNICPAGTLLGLLARHSLFKIHLEQDKCVSCGACAKKCPTGSIDFKNKTVDNETCIKCFNCLSGCSRSGVHYGRAKTYEPAFAPSRRRLLKGALVLAVFAGAAKAGEKLARTAFSKLKKAILPAGAGNPEEFANRCLNCNLCVQNCPMKIIKKADGDYPVVHIDYENGFCYYNCHKCSEVCPTGAIRKISLKEKQVTQIGIARINPDVCVKCGLCVHECPKQIISKNDGEVPVIRTDECIGCGACKNVCPVKAIAVEAVETQKTLQRR